MSENVTQSAEFSNAAILRPFDNFESIYQGLSVEQDPLALPGGVDRLAGKPGYDPKLAAMLPVPLGARVVIWLPRLSSLNYGEDTPEYFYSLVWRIRSQAEATTDAERRSAAHFGQRLQGRPQAPGASPAVDTQGPRFVLPAAIETVAGNLPLAEPRRVSINTALLQVKPPRGWRAPVSSDYPGPLVSQKVGRALIYSQGYYEDTNGTAAPSDANAGFLGAPQYFIYQTVAQGDELALLITRDSGDGGPSWDFTGPDRPLSAFLGNDSGTQSILENAGVYVFTGARAG